MQAVAYSVEDADATLESCAMAGVDLKRSQVIRLGGNVTS